VIFEVLLRIMRQGSNAQYRRVPHAVAIRIIDNAAIGEMLAGHTRHGSAETTAPMQ
jgi:hypothetical protein